MLRIPERKPKVRLNMEADEVYKVVAIQRETADAVSVWLEPTTYVQEHCQFKAGQYLNLQFPIGHQAPVRCYSLSTPPQEGNLRITVKHIPNGLVSGYVTSELQVGTLIAGSRAHGSFFIQDPEQAFLGVAAGSGITPVISMLRHMLQRTSVECRLFYVTPNRESTIFYDELEALAGLYADRLIVHHWHTRDNGHITEDQLEKSLMALAGCHKPDVYLCGPNAWMKQTRIAVQKNPECFGNCYQELFISDEDDSPGSSTNECYHDVILRIGGAEHRLWVAETQTILAAAKAAGLALPAGCEQGKCGSCCANCTSGQVAPGNIDFLTETEIQQGYVLCCQARPRGPCVIEVDAL